MQENDVYLYDGLFYDTKDPFLWVRLSVNGTV